MSGLASWDYSSFKCATPAGVLAAYRKAKKEGWGFSMVYKIRDGYILQMKKRIEGT